MTEFCEYLELLRLRSPERSADSLLEIIDDPEQLAAYSRENHIKLGIVYRSSRHIYVVDLVRDKKGRLFPYERLLKTVTGSSVVIVPIRGDKVILLKQFRYAMGGYQYCFPRGFAEEGISPAENARKELGEELNCKPGEPELLGQVVADSGVCAERVWVFRCPVTEPQLQTGYEGIVSYIEVSLDELKQMVRDGQIDDGFTLSAITLFQNT